MKNFNVTSMLVMLMFMCITSMQAQSITPSKKYITKELNNVSNFSSIRVLGSPDVEYRQSSDSKTTVSIYGSDNLVDLLEVSTVNGVLQVNIKKGVKILSGERRLKVIASSPSLDDVDIKGSADVYLKGTLKGADLNLNITGSGDIEAENLQYTNLSAFIKGSGDIDVKNVKATTVKTIVSGSGDVKMKGSTQTAMLTVNGSGDISADKLTATNANLRIRSVEVQGDSAAIRFHQPESRIQFEHPWPRPMVTTDGHNSAFYLTNARELQDVPGEWYHDIDARKVYYYPREGEKMQEAEVIVPAVETLVRVEGTLDRPVCHIRFEKITFSYTTWMRPSEKGHIPLQAGMYLTDGYRIDPKMQRDYLNHPLDNQGWLGRPAAAVRVAAAKQIDFERCRFEHLGSTGLDYEEAVQGGVVRGCLFRDIAGNGLLVGSFSPAAHETHLPYDPADRREVCTQQHINNCYFTEIGNEDWGCLAIAAGYVGDVNIEHNEISEVPYSGISLGWGWTQTVNCMRNNRVHANLIHHYAKHMYDVAGIYTLGSQPKSYVTENCVHSIYKPGYVHDPNHWFYLYTDEGSSFITVRDNWTEGEKYLQNANGPGNVWENNGPKVDSVIRERAGLEAGYKDLLNIQ